MRSGRVEPELHALRKLAEKLAQEQRERASTAHLLAAIAAGATPAAELLSERRVAPAEALRLGRSAVDDLPDALRAVLQRAHDIAGRMGFTEASSAHLLIALLNEPRCAARRALEQAGVDVGRLRTAAMQVGLGLMRGRRLPAAASSARATLPRESSARESSARESSARESSARASSARESSARGNATPAERPSAARPLRPERVPSPSRAPAARASNAVKVPTVPQIAPRAAQSVALEPPAAAPTAPSRPAGPSIDSGSVALNAAAGSARAASVTPALPQSSPAAREGSERFELDAQKYPTLTQLGRNLTLAAARGELDPVVVRDSAVEQTLDVLAKRQGNNPCLVGAAGVGKTSVVRGLAQRIAASDDLQAHDAKIIVEIAVGELLAGTGVRGALALRMGNIRREVQQSRGRVVVFFDEIHQLFTGDGADEIGSELKLALARGELPCIGATTLEEYQKVIGNDAALCRRFSLVEIEEPTREEAYLVLEALRPKLEAHHQVRYDDEALALGVGWSVRYLPGRALPDKAVSILDLAGARTRRRGRQLVQADAVAEVVAELADMPVERLLESDADRLLRLEEILAERVVGHAAGLRKIARILRRNAAGLGSRRPIGTFLLLGPSGVGKTETAKAIAELLFHCDSAMTRIDLNEYGEAHAVARLIGAPPGYVGHEAGGQLTEAVRRRPYQVILLDELEKAHPDVLTAFLGVFDEGRMTDGRGRTVDFTNTVILMTSNIGAAEAQSARRKVGFGGPEGQHPDLEERIAARARESLAPELYNRIDEVLVFSPLSRDEVREIARRLLASVGRTLHAQRGVELEFTPAVVELLMDRGGFDSALGARPMKRTLARLVEAPLAEKILAGELSRGTVVLLDAENGELSLDLLDREASSSVSVAE